MQEPQPDTAVSAQWVVARFEVGCTRYLDHHGTATLLPDFARDPKALVASYRATVLLRAFDAKAIAMQRSGQIGTYASTLGKEAIDVAIGTQPGKHDVLLPSDRDSAVARLEGRHAPDRCRSTAAIRRTMVFA